MNLKKTTNYFSDKRKGRKINIWTGYSKASKSIPQNCIIHSCTRRTDNFVHLNVGGNRPHVEPTWVASFLHNVHLKWL